MTTQSTLRRTYRRIAPLYDLLDLPFELGRYRHLRPCVFSAVADARMLLDCGTGTGRNTPYYPRGARVAGIDLCAEMIRRADRRSIDAGRPVSHVQADVSCLPWRDDVFDAAAATFLFCVLPDTMQVAALSEIARVVKPGGRIVLLEYVLSHQPRRRWLMTNVWAPWVRFAYQAGFDRRTAEHVEEAGLVLEERRFLYTDTVVLLVARTPSA
jgi:ubiquinone/menaquinone biosynthesis C-methylase UbiE